MNKTINLLEAAVKAADLKRAEDIMAFEVSNISIMADYYMICHGNSTRQVEAITNEIIEKVEEQGGKLNRVEGQSKGSWLLIDFGDIVIHVFTEEERNFYQLEKLWVNAIDVDITKWVTE